MTRGLRAGSRASLLKTCGRPERPPGPGSRTLCPRFRDRGGGERTQGSRSRTRNLRGPNTRRPGANTKPPWSEHRAPVDRTLRPRPPNAWHRCLSLGKGVAGSGNGVAASDPGCFVFGPRGFRVGKDFPVFAPGFPAFGPRVLCVRSRVPCGPLAPLRVRSSPLRGRSRGRWHSGALVRVRSRVREHWGSAPSEPRHSQLFPFSAIP